MKIFVGVTDNEWYDHLSHLSQVDEVNFWQPSADFPFKALMQGELFLFKLHSPRDYIAGGGIFASATILPISIAWETFGEKNGARSYEEMRRRIVKYRRTPDSGWEDFKIGCILLTQPFFLNEHERFRPPEWSASIVRGKGYDLNTETGQFLWKRIEHVMVKRRELYLNGKGRSVVETRERYGREFLIKPRLGQGAFKVLVTDAYDRSCAITRERALPVLEAAHIRPYSAHGPHEVRNGVLLRSDMHKLFDRGYLTITPALHVEVSRRIREEFDNGEYYFMFHGHQIHLPRRSVDQPSAEFLTWHNENVYRG